MQDPGRPYSALHNRSVESSFRAENPPNLGQDTAYFGVLVETGDAGHTVGCAVDEGDGPSICQHPQDTILKLHPLRSRDGGSEPRGRRVDRDHETSRWLFFQLLCQIECIVAVRRTKVHNR